MNLAWSTPSRRAQSLAGAPAKRGQLALPVLGVLVCPIIGVAIAFLPWWLVLSIIIAPAVIVVGAVWPFPAVLLVLVLIFQAFPGRFVPPIGSFRIHELIILYLALVVPLRAIWRRENPLAATGPFIWPLIYLYGCVLMSAVYVKFFAPNASLLSELRSFVTWLILPLIAYAVQTEGQRRTLVFFVAGLSVVVAVYVMTESLFHVSLLDNRTEFLDSSNTDVTRSLAGGTTYLMVFTLLWSINALTKGTRWFPLVLPIAVVVAGGIAVGFGRGVWIATAIGFFVSTWIHKGVRGMLLSVLLAAIALSALMVTFWAVKPRVAEAVLDRALGVSQELKSGGSFRWRQIENGHALAALEKRPFTGVGIGGQYKNRVSAVGTFATETQYIHNAYIGLMVKMGYHAILFPVWMVIAFVLCARRLNKTQGKGGAMDRALFGATVASFFVPVITSITQPEWINAAGVAAICVIVSMLRLMERNHRTKEAAGDPVREGAAASSFWTTPSLPGPCTQAQEAKPRTHH